MRSSAIAEVITVKSNPIILIAWMLNVQDVIRGQHCLMI